MMNPKPFSEAKREELRRVQPALERAARMAREIARQTGTNLVTRREGKVAVVPPEELGEREP